MCGVRGQRSCHGRGRSRVICRLSLWSKDKRDGAAASADGVCSDLRDQFADGGRNTARAPLTHPSICASVQKRAQTLLCQRPSLFDVLRQPKVMTSSVYSPANAPHSMIEVRGHRCGWYSISSPSSDVAHDHQSSYMYALCGLAGAVSNLASNRQQLLPPHSMSADLPSPDICHASGCWPCRRNSKSGSHSGCSDVMEVPPWCCLQLLWQRCAACRCAGRFLSSSYPPRLSANGYWHHYAGGNDTPQPYYASN